MIEKILKDKRISFIFLLLFIFLLFMIVFIILNDNNKSDRNINLTEEDKQLIIKAGNFVSPNLRELSDSDFYIGKKNAQLQIIIYEDVSDYYSLEFNNTIEEIKSNFKNDFVLVFRPYINKSSLDSIYINLWLQCAGEQNKFFEARRLIFEKSSQGLLYRDDLLEYSKELSLDVEKIGACLEGEKYLSYLENIKKEAESYDVYGTPTVFVNSEMIVGSRPFEDVVNGSGEKLEGMKNIINRNLFK